MTAIGAAKRKAPARWTKRREAAFLAALAGSCNVAASARSAKVSTSAVYAQRQKSPAFRAAWEAAIRDAYGRVETLLLDRAINGVRKPVFHGGKQVGHVTEYSDRTALALLERHRAMGTSPGPRAAASAEEHEAAKAALLERLAEMNRRMGGEG